MRATNKIPFRSIERYKRSGYMITQPPYLGAPTGVAAALQIISYSDDMSECAMAYMTIKNTPCTESSQIVAAFLADVRNYVPFFFRVRLEKFVNGHAFSHNQIYRSSIKKLS